MKHVIPELLLLSLTTLMVGRLPAQDREISESAAPAIAYEVKSSRTLPLGDGSGRNVIMQRVKPPILPPPPPLARPVPVDPVARAARRAAAALEAKKDRRILSLSAVAYPNGQTFLSWFTQGPDGKWQTYEAWTLTDFRSAWLVQEFEVGNTIYDIFSMIHPATQWDLRRDFPGPLWFPDGSPGFRLVKGDTSHTKSLEPVAALHEIYRKEGPELSAQWLRQKNLEQAEAAWLKANPPPVRDIVLKVYLLKSNLHPEAEAEAKAAAQAGARDH